MGASNAESSAVPDLLGVPEAAALLRVGLTFAYESTARFIATGSADEIPAIKVGRLTRVPRIALERFMGVPVTWPIPAVGKPSVGAAVSGASEPRSRGRAPEPAASLARAAAGARGPGRRRPSSGSPAPQLFER